MLANCAKSCSMPAPTPAPTTPAPTWHGSCVDESDWCPIWAVGGQCESNPGYMESACKLSCICNPPAPTPAPKPELLVLYAGSGEKEGSLNLVFVPSGFDDINVFNEKVKPIIDSMMNEYSPYDARKVKALNYFILNSKAPGDDGTYCGRYDPPRAVSCKEGPKFQKLVESYIPGLHVETVVLHNEDKYGGSGSKGMAVVTWGDRAYEVLAHELGHSFFGLSDEYELEASFQGIVGTDAVANLDDKDCSKWTDLMDKDLGVGCEGGHGKGKAYFASGKTFMNDIKDPFGAANERISCCKYVKLIAWNDMPVYCHKFSQNGLNLKTFCKSSAVKLWWEGSLFQDGDFKANATREQKLLRQVNDPQGHHYAWVEAPTRWTLSNVEGDWRCVKVNDLPSGIYFKDEVLGHAAEEETLAAEGRADRSLNDEHRIELVVTAWDRNAGSERELIFLPESRAEAPPKVRDGSPGYWGGNTPDTVIEMTDIDFILNQGESCILWVGDSSRRLS